jgi:hypothetical protein
MAQKGLIKNSTLEQLNISDNRIQDSGARALALAFESNKSIELLNITGNGIADEGVSVLMQVFFLFNLTSFRLGSCCADIPHPPLLLQASSGSAPGAAGGFHIWQRVQSRGPQSHRRSQSSESVADGVRVMKFRNKYAAHQRPLHTSIKRCRKCRAVLCWGVFESAACGK